MDILCICKDAQENSVIGNVCLAIQASRHGLKTGVVFTQEALMALAGRSFGWAGLLEGREARMAICKNASALGIEVANEKDPRWTDIPRLLKQAKREGVRLIACPLFSKLLSSKGSVGSSWALW